MAFERPYCPFGEVVAVVVCICKLVVELFCLNGCNEFLGHFVIETLKGWNDPCPFELVVAMIKASDEVVSLSALDGGGKDCIAVIILEDKNVVVDPA